MTGTTKRKTLMLLGLAILITMIIAANLPHLQFQAGMPLPSLQQGQLVSGSAEDDEFVSISAPKFILVLVVLVLTGAALYSIIQLLRGTDWKFILDFLRYVLVISLMVGCLVFMIMLLPGSRSAAPVEIVLPTPQPPVTSPLGAAPPSLLWLVGIGLLAVTVLMAVWIFRPSPQTSPIDLVGWEAEKARQALLTGVDLKDVILQCYRQMSRAMEQEQGIERKDFMTTGEFEKLLESAGIPHEPIHQLTRLFEAVRYGNWQPDAADEQKAIQCLEAIMVYSHRVRRLN